MHMARQNFIRAESSDKRRRALRHQSRTYSDTQYTAGEKVYRGQIAMTGRVQELSYDKMDNKFLSNMCQRILEYM